MGRVKLLKISGGLLLLVGLFHWKFIMLPLAIVSLIGLKYSIPFILSGFPVWLLGTLGGIGLILEYKYAFHVVAIGTAISLVGFLISGAIFQTLSEVFINFPPILLGINLAIVITLGIIRKRGAHEAA